MAEVQSGETANQGRNENRSRRLWTAAILAFVALSGLGLQMRGPLLPVIAEQWNLSDGQLGLVGPAGTVGYVATVLAVGAVAGRIDTQRYFLGGVVTITLSVLAMGLAPLFLAYLSFLIVRGLGTGTVRALDRPMLSHFYPNARGRMFNLYGLAWAVGAASGPAVMTVAVSQGDWRLAYLGLAVGLGVLSVLVWRLDVPADGAESPLDIAGAIELLKTPAIAATAVALVFHTGLEGAMFIWLPTFGERIAGLSPGRASLLLSAFLIAYIPGRLVYTGIAERVGYSTLVVVLEVLTVPVFYLTFFVAEGMETFVGVAVLGALVSGVFPTLVAFATEAAPEYSAPVNAISLATGATSLAVVPLAIGIVSEDFGIRVAMWVPLLLSLAVAPIVLLARRMDPDL